MPRPSSQFTLASEVHQLRKDGVSGPADRMRINFTDWFQFSMDRCLEHGCPGGLKKLIGV